MPAEWEPHRATWIAWPFYEDDFPGKLSAVEWCYTEIVRLLAESEVVEIVCHNASVQAHAVHLLNESHQSLENLRFTVQALNRTWLRDSAPTAVYLADGSLHWVAWKFNAWAKYDNHQLDQQLPARIAEVSGHAKEDALCEDGAQAFVLEGGAFDTDGEGTVLVTEECLLSDIQARNPGMSRSEYESLFAKYLGVEKTIWLAEGCLGDDTHGHIDDIARFVAPGKVVVAVPKDENHPQYARLAANRAILRKAVDAKGRQLEVVSLPMPEDIYYQELQLPASYANFYIANTRVLVPTFNDPADREALEILASLFPEREVRGIHARDLLVGLGTLHCLSQQEPRVSEETSS